MKKYVLASLISLALLLALLPVSAMASELPAETVAKIGDEAFSSLEAAVASVKEGESATITMQKSETLTASVRINGRKNVTLNLNHCTISRGSIPIIVYNGTLNVIGPGAITETENNQFGAIVVYGSSDVNAQGYSVVSVGEGVTLGGWAPIFIDRTNREPSSPDGIPNTQNRACGVKIDINGNLVSPAQAEHTAVGAGVYINGSITEETNCPEINIGKNAVITSTGVGIYAAGYAKWNVSGEVEGASSGIEIRAGELKVEDTAVITATSAFDAPVANPSGSTMTGVAIAVSQHDTNLPIKVDIKGGTISSEGEGGYAIYESDTVADSPAEDVKVQVTGGTFTGDVGSVNETVAISGGSFSTAVEEKYCAPGFVPVTAPNEEGKYTVEMGEANKVQVLAADGVTVKGAYETIDAAIAAAENGETVQLLANVTGQVVIPADKEMVLDLNGKTLTCSTAAAIINNGTLTVKDSNTDEPGKIISKTGIAAGNDSKTTIESGVIESVEGAVITGTSTGATIEIKDGTFSASDNAVVAGNGSNREGEPNIITISGGIFNGEIKTAGYIACGVYAPWKDTITISGGTFNITGGAGVVARAGTVTISNGTFNCTGTATGWVGDNKNEIPSSALVFDESVGYPGMDDSSKIEVTGGEFNAEDSHGAIYALSETEDKTTRVSVKGGAFSSEVDEKYCAEGFVPAQDSDGNYTVAEVTQGSAITLEPTTLYVGQTVTLAAKVDGKTVEAAFAVAAGSENVVTLDSDAGTITGAAVGEATINVTVGKTTVACKITVSTAPVVVPSYSVTVNAAENGTVTASRSFASEGQIITLTVAPAEGYKLAAITATSSTGKELDLTDKGDGKYTFFMPSARVTVTAVFAGTEKPVDPVKDCLKDGTCPASIFDDLYLGSWSHDGIHYCVDKGLMNGMTSTEFAPAGTLTRGMLVTILYRHAGAPAVGDCGFTDVVQGAWYTDAIAWAAGNGIVNGYGNGAFGPNDPITREQMATILYRYARFLGQNVTDLADLTAYTDANSTGDYAKAAMAWCVKQGILNGYGDGTIKPTGTATREEVATVLMRFCER